MCLHSFWTSVEIFEYNLFNEDVTLYGDAVKRYMYMYAIVNIKHCAIDWIESLMTQ